MRFPEFTDFWTQGLIKDFGYFYYGKSAPKWSLSKTATTPCIRYGELYTFDTAQIDKIKSYTEIPVSELKFSKGNEVLVPRVGEDPLDFYKCSYLSIPNVAIGEMISVYNTSENPLFVAYYFRAKMRYEFAKRVEGSNVSNLYFNYLEDIKVHFPRQTEQVKIAKFISLLDQRIDTQSKIIEKLQSQMKAIIDSLIDFSAPQVKFEMLYNVASEGGTPATNNQAYYENGNIPFIKIDDLTEKYIVCHKEHISELGLKNSSAWLIPENSVIYSNGATVGRVAINTYPITTKQGILGIVPFENILTEYLYYLMKTTYFRREVCRITVKGTMECAYLKDLNTITCYLPSIDKQKRTLKLLHSLDEQLELQKLLLHKLKEQKKYLLSNMFI